jgi:hypothetical protein
MAVTLQIMPVTNSCDGCINLVMGLHAVAAPDIGEAEVSTATFDPVRLIDPPHQPVPRTHNPVAAVAVVPGNIADFSTEGARVLRQFGQPNQQPRTERFT